MDNKPNETTNRTPGETKYDDICKMVSKGTSVSAASKKLGVSSAFYYYYKRRENGVKKRKYKKRANKPQQVTALVPVKQTRPVATIIPMSQLKPVDANNQKVLMFMGTPAAIAEVIKQTKGNF